MRIAFTKMHGLGNDFVLIDAWAGQPIPDAARVRRIADRHFGVGCDQLLVIDRPDVPGADIRYRIFNADGSTAGQCGNGIRCVARYLHDRGRLAGERLVAATGERMLEAWLDADGAVRVNMGEPELEPDRIPLLAKARSTVYEMEVAGERLAVGAVSMGNPHAVLVVPDVDVAPVATLGAALEQHPAFPERVNAGFMQVVDRGRIRLRVFERGAGETLACGTGACAAVVSGRVRGLLDARVTVRLRGGELRIDWAGEGETVWMTGPADYVFEGSIDL